MRLKGIVRSLDVSFYLMLVLILVQLMCSVWALTRGFDFTDEAYSYLGFANPGEIDHVGTYYAVLFDKVFGWMGISIVKVRVLRIILILGCGLVFALGLSTWLRSNTSITETQQINLVLFILIGSLLVNASGSQSFTYNLSTTFLLQAIVGLVLYLDQRRYKVSVPDQVLFFIIGGMLFALFAVKFSSAVLLVAAIGVLILLEKREVTVLLAHGSSMILGAIVSGLLFFGSDLIVWLQDYKETLSLAGGVSINNILARYLEDVQYTVSSKIFANALTIVVLVALLFITRQVPGQTMKAIVAIAVGIALTQVVLNRQFYLGGPKHYYTFTGLYTLISFTLLLSALVTAAVAYFRKELSGTTPYKIVALLFMIPLFGSIGTGNLLSIQIIWYSSFIFAAIYLLLMDHAKPVLVVISILVCMNGSAASTSGLVYYPYRINDTLLEETASLTDMGRGGSGESVRINEPTKKSVEDLATLIHLKTNFEEGGPIFSFSPDYYGFIYLLKGVLPGWGWYDEKATPLNCYTLSHSRVDSLNKMIILSPSYYEVDSLYNQCFAALKIDLQRDYENIGTVPYFMGDLDRTLHVYVPKRILK